MLGFITIPTDFISSAGSMATITLNDLKYPAMLLMGVYLAFWVIEIILDKFFPKKEEPEQNNEI